MIDEFRRQYIDKCINGTGSDDEMNQLFTKILIEEFDNDPVKMDELIFSIMAEFTPPQPTLEELASRIATLEAMVEKLIEDR